MEQKATLIFYQKCLIENQFEFFETFRFESASWSYFTSGSRGVSNLFFYLHRSGVKKPLSQFSFKVSSLGNIFLPLLPSFSLFFPLSPIFFSFSPSYFSFSPSFSPTPPPFFSQFLFLIRYLLTSFLSFPLDNPFSTWGPQITKLFYQNKIEIMKEKRDKNFPFVEITSNLFDA